MAYHQNPTAYTTPVYTGTPTNGVWNTLDLSSIVGSQCAIAVVKLADDAVQRIHFRPGDSTRDFTCAGTNGGWGCASLEVDAARAKRGSVCTDASGVIKFKRYSGSGAFSIWLVGWMDASHVDTAAADTPADDFTVIDTGWSDGDLSSDIGAIRALAVVELHRYDANLPVREFYFRPSDETDEIFQSTNPQIGMGPTSWQARYYDTDPENGDHLQILVPTGPDGKIQGKRYWAVTASIKAWVHGFAPDYEASGAELFAAGTPPGTGAWGTLDCTQDTSLNPTGVTGRAFVYLKVTRESAGSGVWSVVTAKDPDDTSENEYFYSGAGPMGIGITFLDIGDVGYICVETDDSGQIEWASNNTTYDLTVELLGYVNGPLPITDYPEVLATASLDAFSSIGTTDYPDSFDASFSSPYHMQEVRSGRYVNKVWDSVRGEWVRWTTDHIDFQGIEYPYSTWASTTGYCVEKVIMENV